MKSYTYSKYNYVQVIEIPKTEIEKIDFALCNQPKETLPSFYDRNKPDILINGGFFGLSCGTTIFNYVDEHKDISIDDAYQVGMGITDDNQLLFGNKKDRNWRDFMSAYPVLVENGEAVKITYATELNYNARRTIIGYNDNTIFFVLVESPGLKYSVMQSIMLDLGCKYAINLDGGGSTKALIDGKQFTKDSTNRAVDNVVAVYLKPVTIPEKIIYRVQIGAFSKKSNAENLRIKISMVPDDINAGYANARVRLIKNLYKVQIGAYSKKENAQRVLEDLKSKGFDAFITTAS